jgi:hypothetical protein
MYCLYLIPPMFALLDDHWIVALTERPALSESTGVSNAVSPTANESRKFCSAGFNGNPAHDPVCVYVQYRWMERLRSSVAGITSTVAVAELPFRVAVTVDVPVRLPITTTSDEPHSLRWLGGPTKSMADVLCSQVKSDPLRIVDALMMTVSPSSSTVEFGPIVTASQNELQSNPSRAEMSTQPGPIAQVRKRNAARRGNARMVSPC